MGQTFCYGCMKPKQHSPVCEHCGFDERQTNLKHQLPIGTLLNDQYILGKVLGQGGFGITYIGWDKLLNMPVAIKEYFPTGIVFRNVSMGPGVEFYSGSEAETFRHHKERFIREARTLAQLASIPEIVQVKTFFEANNTAYIVMEFVEGITLKNYLKRLGRPLTPTEAIGIMAPVLRGLSKVHERGLIHRDISPDNIMIQTNGNIKVIDFGTVRYMNDLQRSKSTESVLKPGFAPMEQYNTQGNIGTWTDVYAICATIHYCMTGKLPADAPSRIESGERLTLLETVPGISQGLIQVLEKGMKIRVADRIQTIPDLEQYLYNPAVLQGGLPGGVMDPGKEKRKRNLLLGIGAAAAAVLVAVTIMGVKEFGGSGKTGESRPAASSVQEAPEAESGQSVSPAEAVVIDESMWIDNVLMQDPLPYDLEDHSAYFVLGHPTIRRMDVLSVTFLDTLKDMPSDSWDVSRDESGAVMAWAEKNGAGYDLYIAAEGGINGKYACAQLFQEYTQVTSIRFNHVFHTDYSVDMRHMFKGCGSLTKVDVVCLNTSSCTDMFAMFDDCGSLRTLDVSGFDTSKVTDMALMFSDCVNIEKLDVRHFNTAKVTDMAFMFDDCETLTYLDLRNFDTRQVWDMSYMLWECISLEELRLGDFDTSSVTSYDSFYHTDKLPDGSVWMNLFDHVIASSNWQENILMADRIDSDLENEYDSPVFGHSVARRRDIRNVIFVDSLQSMGAGSWDVSYKQDGSVMAWLTESGYSTAKYNLYIGANGGINAEEACYRLFQQYINLKEVKLNGVFRTETTENMSYMFRDCESLTKVDIRSLNTSSCTNMFAMFDNCASLTELDVSGFDTSNVEKMALMFCDCVKLKALDVSGFDTRNTVDMAFMFDGCESITTLDVSNFDTSIVWDMSYMFYRCNSLKTLKLGRFDTSSVTSYGSFYHNSTLPDGTVWRNMFE